MKYENSRPPLAVILAAGAGSGLGPLTDKTTPCLLTVGGSFILERMIRNCLSCGISQFVLVLGYRSEDVKEFVNKTFRGIRVTYVMNDRYHDSGTGYALMSAASAIGTAEFIKFDADGVFDTKVLRQLVDADVSNVICIDRSTMGDDVAKVAADEQMHVMQIGKAVDPTPVVGGTIGIEKISAGTGSALFKELAELMDSPLNARDDCNAAYARLVEKGSAFYALDIAGLNWTGITTAADFEAANAMFSSPVTTVSRGQQRALDEAVGKKTPTS